MNGSHSFLTRHTFTKTWSRAVTTKKQYDIPILIPARFSPIQTAIISYL